MSSDTPKQRLLVNDPKPIKLVSDEERNRPIPSWFVDYAHTRTRDYRRRLWITLGGKPEVFDAEHPT